MARKDKMFLIFYEHEKQILKLYRDRIPSVMEDPTTFRTPSLIIHISKNPIAIVRSS
jgi:hypothetical protein